MNLMSNPEGLDYSADDMRRKFEGAYFLFRHIPKNKLFVDLVIEYGPVATIFDLHERVQPADLEIVKEIPDSGVYNLPKIGIVIYNRTPVRQFKRGLHRDVVRLTGADGGPVELNKGIAECLFMPTKYTMKQGIELLKQQKKLKAVAIGNEHKYWLKREGDGLTLFRNRLRVGVFNGNTFWRDESCESIAVELHDDLGV
jgi:hypothetical protein